MMRVSGVRIDALPIEVATHAIASGEVTGAVHLCNAYTLSLASRDRMYADALGRGTLNLPDGKPLVWIAHWLGIDTLTRRVYGPELMGAAIDVGQGLRTRHYLYGGTEQVLTTLRERIAERWPGAEVVGAESPPFRDLSDDELSAAIERMAMLHAEVVWVGLGTPKQDLVVDRLAAISPERAYIAIGAAFDFLAGSKRQAPGFMREHGLEWLFRLATEPGRLWRRYLIGNTIFLWSMVKYRPRLIESALKLGPASR